MTDNLKKPRNIGVIYAEESDRGLTHPFFVLILDAFKREAEARGYDITFINNYENGNELSYLQHCRLSQVDGACLICADYASAEVKELVESDLPCVTLDHIFKRVPAVLSDNETGMQSLVEYAIRKGHRRIAFVHGHNNSIVTKSRISQFINTMEYYGYPVPSEYLREGLYDDIPLTRQIVTELLSLPERPTCILLPDDITYLGAQEAAKELGLRIPHDISFAGYDCIPLSQVLSPKLTTISQSMNELGKVAAIRLTDLIEHPETAHRFPSVFPVRLIEGETIADLT